MSFQKGNVIAKKGKKLKMASHYIYLYITLYNLY